MINGHDRVNDYGIPITDCKWCGDDTTFLGTKECDGCHQIRVHATYNIEVARKIINALMDAQAVASTPPVEAGSTPETTETLERLLKEGNTHWWDAVNRDEDYHNEQREFEDREY